MKCFYADCDKTPETHSGQFVNENKYWVCNECEVVYQEFLEQYDVVKKAVLPRKQRTVFYLEE